MLPPVAALDTVTIIGLADDGDVGLSVTTSVVRSAGGSGSDGDKSGNDELKYKHVINIIIIFLNSFFFYFLTSFMVVGICSVGYQLILNFMSFEAYIPSLRVLNLSYNSESTGTTGIE